jgi:uncharacterized damage-inducible protein DinB
MSETQRIQTLLQQAFEGNAWHGPALRRLLTGVSASNAAARPLANAHSIWEIVLHTATWEEVVRRRLRGETVVDLPPDQDWPSVRDTSEAAWHKAVQDLEQGNRALREMIVQIEDSGLTDDVPGKDHSVYTMLHGIIQHDLYHAGQIAVLKKAQSWQPRGT